MVCRVREVETDRTGCELACEALRTRAGVLEGEPLRLVRALVAHRQRRPVGEVEKAGIADAVERSRLTRLQESRTPLARVRRCSRIGVPSAKNPFPVNRYEKK